MFSATPSLTTGASLPEAADPPAIAFHPASVSFWSASAQTQTAGTSGRLRRRTKFLLRALSQPRLTRAWLARLVQPDVAPLWAARPRLALKLQRPYVCCAWGSTERFAALLRHYDILPQLFAPEVRAAIYGDGINLVRLTHAETGWRWDIRLFYHDKFEKEGELTLAIREVETGVMLAGLTFCLAHNDNKRIAIIGGIQASRDPRTRRLIHDAAKALYGLRPKALVLWCLQQLAQPWQLTQIQAVGDAQHVWRHWRKRLEIAACYDDFWRESDGRELPGGGSWELPLETRARTREELKPSRRKTYERRCAMLDALQPTLLAAFAALAPGGQALTALAAGPVEFICSNQDKVSIPPTTPRIGEFLATNHSF
jgi:uncharacterized protein VirK/YbjX